MHRKINRVLWGATALMLALSAVPAGTAFAAETKAKAARPLVVAAENVYGQIAQQLAGKDADVVSILANPAADPHGFEPSPATAKLLARASITIANGAGYDSWMQKLLAANPKAGRRDIVVADVAHAAPGANPHLWYQPNAVLAGATALASALGAADPAHAFGYATKLSQVQADLAWVLGAIAALNGTYGHAPVAATEPVFDDMAAAIGLDLHGHGFALAVMNATEPSASAIAAFEDDLRQHRVRVVIYNSQVTSPAAARMLGIAKAANIPLVAVSELLPAHTTYLAWMHGQLDALAGALAATAPAEHAAAAAAAPPKK